MMKQFNDQLIVAPRLSHRRRALGPISETEFNCEVRRPVSIRSIENLDQSPKSASAGCYSSNRLIVSISFNSLNSTVESPTAQTKRSVRVDDGDRKQLTFRP